MTDTAQPAAALDAVTSNDIRDTTEPPVPPAAPPPALPDGPSDDTGKHAQANSGDTAGTVPCQQTRKPGQSDST